LVPGRRGCPHFAERLRKDGERAGRDVPVLERGHHVLDRQDLAWSQSMGRRVRAGRLIVQRTRVLKPSPRMEATRGQSQEPQECPQRHKVTGTIHGPQDPDFVASVGQTLVRQGESGASKQGESEPKECRELLHASPELQDFLLKFQGLQVRYVHAYREPRCLAEPATGRRARNPEIRGDGHVPGAVDEIPKPVVVALLRAPRSRHEDDHPAVR